MPIAGEPVPLVTDPAAALYGLRAEALRSVDPAVRQAHWAAAFDHVFAAIGAKRAKRPIVTFADSWGISLVVRLGDIYALGYGRGLKPTAGQDTWLLEEIKNVREDLSLLEEGRRIPAFTDSSPTKDEASARLAYHETSADAWARVISGCGCGSRWW